MQKVLQQEVHVNIHIKILVLLTGVTRKFCLHEPSNPFLMGGGGGGGAMPMHKSVIKKLTRRFSLIQTCHLIWS